MSIGEIAENRGLAPSTIASHLERIIRDGREIEIDRLLDPDARKKIDHAFLSTGQWALKPVVEHFNGSVSYEDARIARAWLQMKKNRG